MTIKDKAKQHYELMQKSVNVSMDVILSTSPENMSIAIYEDGYKQALCDVLEIIERPLRDAPSMDPYERAYRSGYRQCQRKYANQIKLIQETPSGQVPNP